MNNNRHRNVFTLGSQEQPKKRRQQIDPFERDPFKIQSYNFRYAERPCFPTAASQQRLANEQKDCETYFYNYDFPSTNNVNIDSTTRSATSPNDTGAQNLTKFQQYRKRRILNETLPHRSSSYLKVGKDMSSKACQYSQTSNAVSNLYNDKSNFKPTQASWKKDDNSSTFCQKEANNNSTLNIKTQASVRGEIKPESTNPLNCSNYPSTSQPVISTHQHQTMPFSSSSVSVNADRVTGSGCVININIKGLENSSQQDNVNIKIKTDSVYKNLNMPFLHSNESKNVANRLGSSTSCGLNKRLSKISTNPGKRNERAKDLTAIYSSAKYIKPSRANNFSSFERLPSLITYKSCDSRRNPASSVLKENYTCKKASFVPKVKDKLSVYGKKNLERSRSHHILKRSSNNLEKSREFKVSESTSKGSFFNKFQKGQHIPMVASMHCLSSSSPYKSTSPLILRNARLPLNVNINLFTDRLKLLKI